MKYITVAFLLLPQLAFAQLISEKTFSSGARAVVLNDTQIYNPEITWAVTVRNSMDVLQPGAKIKQTFKGTLGQALVERIFRETLPVYSFIFWGEKLSVPTNGAIYEGNQSGLVFDSNLPDSGYGVGLDKELRHIFFMQNISWNTVEQKLTSKITWVGIAKQMPDRDADTLTVIPQLFVRIVDSKQPNTRKPIWETDNYFATRFEGYDAPVTKKMFEQTLAWILAESFLYKAWHGADNEEPSRFTLKETDGVTPLKHRTLYERFITISDTITIIDNIAGEERRGVIDEVFDPALMQFYGVLQHITIYDDWSASVRIKGLKLFYRYKGTDVETPVGWIYFE